MIQDQVIAGDRLRRPGTDRVFVVTKTVTDAQGICRVWYRREDGRIISYPGITETWEYEQNVKIDFERAS